MPRASRREHLVDTALGLFQQHGFHATGIDTILSEAGVSKKTLYRHFRSKDELILACLKKFDGIFRNDFMRQVEERGDTPEGQLLAVFDVAGDWFRSNKFFGCMFINAVGEHSAPDTALRQVCKEYKAQMRTYIKTLAKKADLADPEGLSGKLAMILEGAIVTAQVSEANDAATTAKSTAKLLIQEARG